ncbi:class I adenylate-forming enzyme family protein [Streptomyces sp. V2I9]|uniref:class I adenylate-forming enzyme family protein n=1 Tax=Streptomyces sp. V2I9 TaxID=3042304 RepID=UPI00277E2F14|nr:class I adenylate-forming enzyme family protein [Streptomyces sp. V2I9]MDQ0985063.1 long-chain acyl-CoA synthetase [Streptomyces sp. V2I9]
MPHIQPPPPPPPPSPASEDGAERARRAARIEASLTAPGAPFAVVVGERGVPEYADGPRTLREFVETTWAYRDAPFLITGERTCSYGEFFAAASALAVRLRERYGLRSGDRAVIALLNLPAWQIAFWAAQLAGLVAVPLDVRWTEGAFVQVLDDCEPAVLLVDGERLERAAGWARRAGARVVLLPGSEGAGSEAPGLRIERYEEFPAPDPLAAPPDVEPRPEDDATILYTSRTAGRTRGAVATHLAQAGAAINPRYHAAASALARGDIPGLGSAPVVRLTCPFPDPAAFTVLYGAMAVGGAIDLTDEPAAAGPPVERTGEPGGGASQGTGALPLGGYGLAETGGTVLASFGDGDGDGLGTGAGAGGAGRPTPVTEVWIAGPSGEGLPDGEEGELWLRGQSLFRGYWRDAAATEAAFGDGGWFRTGDRAVLREGWVSIVGRTGGV